MEMNISNEVMHTVMNSLRSSQASLKHQIRDKENTGCSKNDMIYTILLNQSEEVKEAIRVFEEFGF